MDESCEGGRKSPREKNIEAHCTKRTPAAFSPLSRIVYGWSIPKAAPVLRLKNVGIQPSMACRASLNPGISPASAVRLCSTRCCAVARGIHPMSAATPKARGNWVQHGKH